MSDFVGGALKLKSAPSSVQKKKKSKDKDKNKEKIVESVKELNEKEKSPSPIVPVDRRTPAEKAFEESMKKRQEKRIEKLASKSHKDKVAEFNEKLEKLSEHHDIPKVGPG